MDSSNMKRTMQDFAQEIQNAIGGSAYISAEALNWLNDISEGIESPCEKQRDALLSALRGVLPHCLAKPNSEIMRAARAALGEGS